jgi:hypothetical protein
MKNSIRLAAIVACVGCAGSAFAQDSVSRNSDGGNGLPGDALQAHRNAPGYQRSDYVVDLRSFTTSWGTTFGIAPIIKGSKATTNQFFGSLISAQSISQTLRSVPAPTATFTAWTGPGFGVHPVENNPGEPAATCGTGTQFGVGFSEFYTESALAASDGPTNRSINNIIAGNVWFNPKNPGRMFVSRTVAAQNADAFNPALTGVANGDRSQFGFGAVDSSGNIVFRADAFGSTGTIDRLVGNNYFRVLFDARNASVINVIDNTPTSDVPALASSDWVVRNRTGTNSNHNTPSMIPEDLAASGAGRILGSNFGANYVFENTPGNSTTATTHRGALPDQRGGINFSATQLFPSIGSVGTAGILLKDTFGSNPSGDVFTLGLWAIDGNGNVGTGRQLRMPAAISDGCYNFTFNAGPNGPNFFSYYQSQTFARGGVQVAIGKDAQGLGLAAATMTANFVASNDNPVNAITAVRFDPTNPNSTPQWGLVAWIDPLNGGTPQGGKVVLDGPGGTPVGRLAQLNEITGAPLGPSISSPAFDSAGNIWFIGTVEIFNPNGPSNFDVCLLRAVYNPATFCWDLELVLDVGRPFRGVNSDLRYQIRFINLSDGDSIDSATLWANNVTQKAWNDTDPSLYETRDPRTLGGLVMQAQIVYDVGGRNGENEPDGNFDIPSGTTPQFPNSRDEAYNVLLYIGAVPEVCAADFNNDGSSDFFDYLDFVAAFDAEDCSADFNADGSVDFFDYLDFVAAFDIGCP